MDCRMQKAYEKDSYKEAQKELLKLKKELSADNKEASNSLEEGLEETLTLHRLEVATPLRRSLRTTNIIENFNGLFARRIRRIDRWTHSNQRHRWTAIAIKMEVSRLKDLTAAKHLPKLQEVLRKCAKKPYTDAGASPSPSP
ncbi:MAG: transposase [Bacteroidota bacterium]|nr:transposase [Bacteroidota bacterium]